MPPRPREGGPLNGPVMGARLIAFHSDAAPPEVPETAPVSIPVPRHCKVAAVPGRLAARRRAEPVCTSPGHTCGPVSQAHKFPSGPRRRQARAGQVNRSFYIEEDYSK